MSEKKNSTNTEYEKYMEEFFRCVSMGEKQQIEKILNNSPELIDQLDLVCSCSHSHLYLALQFNVLC